MDSSTKLANKQSHKTPESPFIAAQVTIWRSILSTTQKILLLAILAHWSAASPTPYPSIPTLAAFTGLGERAIYKNTKLLEKAGVLRVIRAANEVNRYDLTAVFAGRLPLAAGGDPSAAGGDPSSPQGCTQGQSSGAPRASRISPVNISKEYEEPAGAVALDFAGSEPESEKEVTKLYCAEYARVRGEQPVFAEPDRRAVQQLVKAVGRKKAEQAIRCAFAHEFHGPQVTIREIRSNPAKFIGLKNSKGPSQSKTIEYDDSSHKPTASPFHRPPDNPKTQQDRDRALAARERELAAKRSNVSPEDERQFLAQAGGPVGAVTALAAGIG